MFSFSQDNDDCMMCHADPDLTGFNKENVEISMYVDLERYEESSHAGLSCIDCHQDLDGMEDYPHADDLENVNCGNCHSDVQEIYNETLHGTKFINRVDLAPKCSDCHGAHTILPSTDPASNTYFQNLPNTCCSCHTKRGEATKGVFKQPCVIEEYLQGVHGKLVSEGFDAAPTCNTCHPAHSIRKRIDPQSTIYKLNISNTCGQCHIDALTDYSESIHASALLHGVLESATCTDCHGEHEILHPDSARLAASHDVCIKCHTDPELVRKYDLSESVVSTYVDSYHGLSVRLGREDAATCGSCHGHHHIHPSDHAHSSTHESNIVATCNKCHPNSSESFAKSYTHEAMLIQGNPVNYYITLIYVILIVGIIGAMFGHNLIIFFKYIRYKKKEEKDYYIVRFKPSEVFQHGVLMLSFTVLAISGFALKFPEAWWVEMFGAMGIDEWGRRMIHRVSAVIMVLISLYHIYYLIFTKRGRYLFKQIMIKFGDIPEVFQTVKYYLGLSKTKPEYEEFDYTEKVEYWAVVWGNIVMTLTGLILWFPALVTGFAPSWIIRASELIHYYEAILATLAIVIFHLFFVIIHPEQYPMNLSWLTGKMSLRAAIHKHPGWIKRLFREKTNLELLPEVIRANCESIEDIEKFLKFGELYKQIEKGPVY
jgi:cytochrome b subunit of formate dehydrogenase/nitrate/TMAO reductase-like tetraheme cytochrome c subunit